MSFVKGFLSGFMEFGHNMSEIINVFLLSIVYLVGIGLTSIFAKIKGKHFLHTEKEKGSYWSKLNLKKKPFDEYYRQF